VINASDQGVSLRNHGYREVLKVLRRRGFAIKRQKGSHIVLAHPDGRYATVPRHEPIKEPTLKSILDQAKISVEEFLREV
jgi:predicted RNA binding protein YcfA (HicA-like mRNA interferase family)